MASLTTFPRLQHAAGSFLGLTGESDRLASKRISSTSYPRQAVRSVRASHTQLCHSSEKHPDDSSAHASTSTADAPAISSLTSASHAAGSSIPVSRRILFSVPGLLAGSTMVQGLLSDRRPAENGVQSPWDLLFTSPAHAVADKERIEYDQLRLLEQNRRIQALNNAPPGFPGFVRNSFEVKVVRDNNFKESPSGLIYSDIEEGTGPEPTPGQLVVFHYTGYNESGRKVDSSYQQGQPAQTRIGLKAMIPGVEEGIQTMKVGGKRRIIVPPDLGPPTGPGTFFSAKQFEVFDIELLGVKDCVRKTVVFFSNVVCD